MTPDPTCLGFFQIADQIAVGPVTDMREIAATLIAASKVVTV
jgi:hypothetical protein